MARFDTPEGRSEWIEHMVALSIENSGFPDTSFKMRFLVEWVHEDCRLRWGATIEEVTGHVETILEGFK